MVREEDRPALRRIINAVFAIEADNQEELRAIANDESITKQERAERYVDCIIDHLEYMPENPIQ